MNDDPELDSYSPDGDVVAEYESLAAGEFAEGPLGRLLFIVSTTDLAASHGDVYVGLGLAKYLRRLGWGIVLWPRERWDEQTPPGIDTAIVMIESYAPGLVHPDTRVIAWIRNWTDEWAALPYLDTFDQLWCSSTLAAERMRSVYDGPVELLPLATDSELFTQVEVPRTRDVVTTANYWGAERGVFAAIESLAAENQVTWFGRNVEARELLPGIEHARRVDYFSLSFVYSAWKFVIDDAIPPAREYGMQNSRLFDALGCGATVMTNNAAGLDELGLGETPSYGEPDQLAELVRSAKTDDEATAARASRLRDIVLARHTYAQRAEDAAEFLGRPRRAAAERTDLLAWSSHLRERVRQYEQSNHELLNRAHGAESSHADLVAERTALTAQRDDLQYWYDLAVLRISILETEAENRPARRVANNLKRLAPSRIAARLRRGDGTRGQDARGQGADEKASPSE